MGDRTHCTLTLSGIVLREQLDLICDAIEDEDGKHASDAMADLKECGRLQFEEVNYAQMGASIRDVIIQSDLSYTWAWDSGGEYPEGVEIYDAKTKELSNFGTLEGKIALTVDHITDPEKIQRALDAHQVCLSIRKSRLIVAESSHDKIELISKHPELAAQV